MNANHPVLPPDRFLPPTGNVFLFRHGHAESGNAKRFIGQTDLALSQRGSRQAEFWQQWLAEIPLSTIAASDLSRAHDTATIIAAGRQLDLQLHAALREIHLGSWEGKTFEEIRSKQPKDFAARGADPAGFRPPEGESFSDLQCRVLPVFRRITAAVQDNLVIVGHAGVNRVILCHLLGMPLSHLFRLGQAYGALNILRTRTAAWRIEALNLISPF